MRRLATSSRWFLHCAAVLCCFLVLLGQESRNVDALRATSLIFKKSTTEPSTTVAEAEAAEDVEQSTEAEAVETKPGKPKPVLTGIPQIDYVHDPNLPRELNGFNLSSYPFLDSVPDVDEMEFKCDEKLKDGFYADVQYGCQLYHQCLHGVRYDFLCANFTAFDQKTFICHFVSEVDCKNSNKYWHRNNDLYKATTARPVPTTPTTTTTTTTPAPYHEHRPGGGRPRRPFRRRRPQVEYYDDEYEDDYYYEEAPKRRRKQRPRPRRPTQYDDDYADEMPRAEMPQDDYEYDRRMERPLRRRPSYDDRRSFDGEERKRPADERRSFDNRNRKNTYETTTGGRRRPAGDRRPMGDFDQPRKPLRNRDELEDDYERPARPAPNRAEHDEDVKVKPSGTGATPSLFAPRTPPKIRRPVPLNARDKYDYTSKGGGSGSPPAAGGPSSTTEKPLFDDDDYYDDDYPVDGEADNRKYAPPEKEKPPTTTSTTSTTTTTTTTTPSPPPPTQRPRKPEIITDEEYYDDEYEDEPLPPVRGKYYDKNNNGEDNGRSTGNSGGRAQSSSSSSSSSQNHAPNPSHQSPKTLHQEQEHPTTTTTTTTSKPTTTTTERPQQNRNSNRFRGEEEDQVREVDPPQFSSRYQDPAAQQRQTTIKPTPFAFNPKYQFQITSFPKQQPSAQQQQQQQQPRQQEAASPKDFEDEEEPENANREIRLRVHKRPFLPSRGGNANLPRGLQPVGHLNPYQPTTTTPKPSAYYEKLEEIYNTDYDVTLNDALNPTLKPFSTRGAVPAATVAYPQQQSPLISNRNFVERNRFAGRYDSLEAPASYRQAAILPRVQRPLNVYQQPYVAMGNIRRRDETSGQLRAQASSHYPRQRAARDYYDN